MSGIATCIVCGKPAIGTCTATSSIHHRTSNPMTAQQPGEKVVENCVDLSGAKQPAPRSSMDDEEADAAVAAEYALAHRTAIEALQPFALYYEINDCKDRRDDDALEVPIGDLRAAYEAYRDLLADGEAIEETTPVALANESATQFSKSEPADEIERLRSALAEMTDDYLRVHKQSVDHLERALIAEAQLSTVREQALEECQSCHYWRQRAEAAETEFMKFFTNPDKKPEAGHG